MAGLVKAGRLLVGPWYVLADELLSSDETLVRNLLAGRRAGEAVGGWLPLGYSPDAFGHPAALPTILSGFGIRCGILWRGYGGEPGQESDTFRWSGPDGSRVTFHHLPPAGYEVGASLPKNDTALRDRWKELEAVLGPRARAPALLVLAGADHHSVDPELPARVAQLNALLPGYSFRIAAPLDYFAALRDSQSPPEVRGELRFASTACPVWSPESDRLLVRWAEPQCALAIIAGTGGNDLGRRALLWSAWREHLLNHSHDSLGGCVADPVARVIAGRASSVIDQARGLLVDALHDRLGQDRARARRERERWMPALVVVNPSPSPASHVIEATVTAFVDDVIVGRPDREPRVSRRPPVPRLVDPDGRPIPLQLLDEYDAFERLDSPSDYPDQDRVCAFRVALDAGTVPALGLKRLAVTQGSGTAVAVKHGVRAKGSELRTAWGEVRGDGHRGFSLVDRQGRVKLDSLAELVSERDEGDTYTFQPVRRDRAMVGHWSPARRVWEGPLVAAIQRDVRVGDRTRAVVAARVDAGSTLVRFVVEGTNFAGNHRLRVSFPFPTGVKAVRSVADMQYGPVTRERRDHDLDDFPREWPVTTAPVHRYVSVKAGDFGLTVFPRGVFEYELMDGAIAVTLFRAVGDLSRGDLAARPGHAGWPVATPLAQEVGRFRVELAVSAVGVEEASPASEWEKIERLAEEFHAPGAGLMLRYGIDVPSSVAGPELEGAGLAFKSLKPREQGEGVVARCVNLTGLPVRGLWRWPSAVSRAFLARLDESVVEEIPLGAEQREIRFTAAPREVVTVMVERERSTSPLR